MFRQEEEQAIGKSRVGRSWELGDMNGLLSGEETVNAHRRNTTCYEHRCSVGDIECTESNTVEHSETL